MSYYILYTDNIQYSETTNLISQIPFASNADILVVKDGQMCSGKIWIGEYFVNNITGYVYNMYVSVDIFGDNEITIKENDRIIFNDVIHQSTLQRFKLKIPLFHNVTNTNYTVELLNSNTFNMCKVKLTGL